MREHCDLVKNKKRKKKKEAEYFQSTIKAFTNLPIFRHQEYDDCMIVLDYLKDRCYAFCIVINSS